MAQSVKHLTSARVVSSQFVSLSPTSSSALTTRGLLGILSAPPPLVLFLSLTKKERNFKDKTNRQKKKKTTFAGEGGSSSVLLGTRPALALRRRMTFHESPAHPLLVLGIRAEAEARRLFTVSFLGNRTREHPVD